MFENRLLKKIFGSKREEITKDWKGMRSEWHHHLYSSRNITRNIKKKMRLVGHVACMGDRRGAYRV
jgi:hypothetical protein